MRNHIVEVDILVSPLEVVDDAFVRQLFLHDEDVLEKVNDALVDIKVIELSNHGLLVFQVTLVGIDEGVAFVDDTPDVVECLGVRISLQVGQSVIQRLVFSLLALKFEVHILDFVIVALQLVNDHLLVLTIRKLGLDLVEIADYLREFVRVSLLGSRLFKKFLCLIPQLIDLVVKHVEHRL